MKKRSRAPEIMDDLELGGPQLRHTLKLLARINALLGGDGVTLKGVKKALHGTTHLKGLHIVDVGCGEGSQLRVLARYSRKHKLDWHFSGVDANGDAPGEGGPVEGHHPLGSVEADDVDSCELWQSQCHQGFSDPHRLFEVLLVAPCHPLLIPLH